MEIGLGVTLGLPQLASLAGDRGNWLGSRPENIIAKSAYCSIPYSHFVLPIILSNFRSFLPIILCKLNAHKTDHANRFQV